jgi:hypothetical protein
LLEACPSRLILSSPEKGDDISEKLLRELIAYEEFANINKIDSDEPFKVKKGVKSGVVYDPGLQRVERR